MRERRGGVQHSLILKALIVALPLVVIGWYSVISLKAPVHQNNLCLMFKEHPSWYWSAQKAQERWGVPISVQMAIIHRESHFRADVKPRPKRLLGFIPWMRPTSAEGYAQVVDGTWQDYLKSTHQRSARRSSFSNAVDFVGWYVDQLHRQLGISKVDAASLYMAYYLGPGGYRSGRYQNNAWLQGVAHKVGEQQAIYHQALVRCASSLPKRAWWYVW